MSGITKFIGLDREPEWANQKDLNGRLKLVSLDWMFWVNLFLRDLTETLLSLNPNWGIWTKQIAS